VRCFFVVLWLLVCASCLSVLRLVHSPTEYLPAHTTQTTTASFEAPDFAWDEAAGGSGAGGADDDGGLAAMAPFENYILGILTNFGAVGLDRLHHLLRAFVVGEPRYDGRTAEQLAAYLGHLAAAGKVAADNGVYRRLKGAGWQ
jgi:hypothetical protein